MRIAMLPPVKRPITASSTAGRLRVMVDLMQGLVARGHAVTLFGTADSVLDGVKLFPSVDAALINSPIVENPFYQHTAALTSIIADVLHNQGDFDIVHNHMYPEFLPMLVSDQLQIPMVTTVHGQMTPDVLHGMSRFPEAQVVAISDAAATAAGRPMTRVYNGIDTAWFTPTTGEHAEALFVGRLGSARDASGNHIDPKGVQDALAAARQTGLPLRIVASVEDRAFYDTAVVPHLSATIQFEGEISSEQIIRRERVRNLYQRAKVLLFPIRWEEPFGLALVEAMACGTPVIAYNRGSVSEIVRDGSTGYIVDPHDGIDGLVAAIKKLTALSPDAYHVMRKACRKQVEDNFTLAKMVDNYETLYQTLLSQK